MSEREGLIEQICRLQEHRAELMVQERMLNRAFWREPDESEARTIDNALDDICGEIDEVGDKIGVLKARLHVIEASIGLGEFVADVAYGRSR